ncbi:squalene monooxygenase-like [Protopterus annectens]|uniref:squalene monooxygenase-like n=1 Tax=Protopterus annectens TaxID=7888 RepID=UPI001CF9D61D|nr:squalene monooxygenase-like [Protopterus annectens]
MYFEPQMQYRNQHNSAPCTEPLSRESAVEEPDIIVVGGGILGAAFATVMAKDGRKVTMIERDMKEPDTIAGEIVQPGGIKLLQELGLHDAIKGKDAAPIRGYCIKDLIFNMKSTLPLPLSENKEVIEAKGLHHGRFVMGLRKLAMAEPNVTVIEGNVTSLLEENACVIGVQYKDKEGGDVKKLYAPLTLVADGIFSNLRKSLISRKPQVTSQFTGVIMEVLPGQNITTLLSCSVKSRAIVMYPISTTETRVMVDTTGIQPRNLKNFLQEEAYSYIPDHQKEAFLLGLQNDNLKSFPTRYVPAVAVDKPGVLVLGDAFNLRHPFTAAGMTIILNDIAIFKQLLQNIPDLYDDKAILKAKRQFYAIRKKKFSFVMNILAELIYKLFTATDESVIQIRKALIFRSSLSEEWSLKLSLQVAGLSTKPWTLIKVCLDIVLCAVYLTFKSEPWYTKPRAIFRTGVMLHRASALLLPLIFSELKHHDN